MKTKSKQRLAILALALILIISAIIYLTFLKKQAQKQTQPNVILIVIDALRPDHLSCYGYKRNTSPNIDKFAKEGVLFTQAISQIPETQSSVASFITSTYPYMHYRDYDNDWSCLNPATVSIAKILKEAGYATGLITDFMEPNQIFKIEGLKDDFDKSLEVISNNPRELTKKALNWLRKNKNKKFLLYLHYFGCHIPYNNVPLPFYKTYLRDGYSKTNKYIPIALEDNKDYILDFIPKGLAEDGITNVDYYICKYDGKIRFVDEQIGRLFKSIRKLGLDKKTLIILISDHGESLGEHHLYFQHVLTLYEELIKVPLIMKYSGFLPKNIVINYQVRLMDIVPTILEMLGIEKSNYKYMEGVSLLPFILNKKNYPDRLTFGQGGINRIKYLVRTETWKLIYEDYQKIWFTVPLWNPPNFLKNKKNFPKVYELYNLKEDPYELNNLIDEEKDVFSSLKPKLDEYIIKAEKQAKEARETAEIYLKTNKIKPLGQDSREKLKSLGYIQ